MLNKRSLFVFLFLASAGFCVFYRGLWAGFVADDFIWLEKSQHLSEFNLFDPNSFAFTKGRPGTMALFSLLNNVFPLKPTGFHCVTLIFHVLNALMLFWLLQSFRLDFGFGFLASLLFLAHFSNEENIFWAVSLCTVFCLFFYLCAVLAFLRWLENSNTTFKVLGLLFSFLAVSIREDAVTIPLVFMAINFWKNRDLDGKPLTFFSLLKRNLVFFLPSLFFLTYRLSSLLQDTKGYSFSFNPIIWVQNVVYFPVNLVIPLRYIFDKIGYDIQASIRNQLLSFHSFGARAIGIALILLIFFFMGWKAKKRIPVPIKVGLVLFLIGMLPYLFLVGNAPRFLYFSLIGGAIVVSSVFYLIARWLSKTNLEKFVLVFVTVFVVGSSLVLYGRAGWWVNAGKAVENIIAESAVLAGNLENNETAYVVNLPRRMNGVYIFHIGYNEALTLFHPETARKLQDIGSKGPYELRNYKDRRIFTYKGGKMVEVKAP